MNRRITVQENQGIKKDPMSKLTNTKSDESMAQIKNLLSKCKALSSTASTTIKKNTVLIFLM
jgi:hypothetical protein